MLARKTIQKMAVYCCWECEVMGGWTDATRRLTMVMSGMIKNDGKTVPIIASNFLKIIEIGMNNNID